MKPNTSKKPLWRIFRFFTTTRDVYISLVAMQFVHGSAKVGDALFIPDVMPEDVFELKRLVFDMVNSPC